VTKGIPRKQQLADQRRKRAAAAAGLAKGAKSPARPIPVPSAAAHYPVKRVAIGARQAPLAPVAPLGRADK
jgi:hypothetical protein